MAIPAHIRQILESAILAPSGDNCQPWQFKIQGDRIQVFNIPGKDTSLFNFKQTASLVAHGALVENMVIAASAAGYAATVRAFPEPGVPNLVASVELQKAALPCDPLYPFLPARATNRKRYGGGALSASEREALLAAGQDGCGAKLRLLEGDTEKKSVAKIIGLNDRLVFENRYLHAFLYDHIRWSDAEARSAGDGLDVKTLDLAPPDALALKFFKRWSLLPVFNTFGVSRIIGKSAEKLALSAAALGAVAVGGNSSADYFCGGRLVQRVWLESTRCGLSFQPMTGIVFLMNRVLEGATEELSASQVGVIRQARQQLDAAFGLAGETVVMMFRVGRSSPPSARSLRLPVERALDW